MAGVPLSWEMEIWLRFLSAREYILGLIFLLTHEAFRKKKNLDYPVVQLLDRYALLFIYLKGKC